MPRRGLLPLPALISFLLAACAGQPPSQAIISYATTPAPAELALLPSPTPARAHRPTRLPLASRRRGSPAAPLDVTTTPAAGTLATPALGEPTVPLADQPAGSAAPALSDQPPAARLPPDSTTPTGSAESAATPSGVSTSPTSVSGQVSEAQGQFVTSSGHSARYYYARTDTGWHRIRADRRVWFLSPEALLAAFPGRILHLHHPPTATPGG